MSNLDFKKYITKELGFKICYSLTSKRGYLVYKKNNYILELYTNLTYSLILTDKTNDKYVIYSKNLNEYKLLNEHFLQALRKMKIKKILKKYE